MEERKANEKLRSILLKKDPIKKASTYGHSQVVGLIEKSTKKKVGFVDRAKTTPLCTFFHYEQVEVEEEVIVKSSKTCSCVCIII